VKPVAICFDATGTLIETAESVGEVYGRVAREFGVDLPAWRLDDAFRRILLRAPTRGAEGPSVEARRVSEKSWWFERIRETFQATDSTARFADFQAFAAALFETYRAPGAWRLRPGTREMLTAIRRAGLPMTVASNFDHRLPEILEVLEISPFFDFLSIPSLTGRAKPERAVFELILAALSMPELREGPLDGLLYVGDDSPATLQAIENLGLHVIDVHRLEEGESLADRVLRAATLSPQQDDLHRPRQD